MHAIVGWELEVIAPKLCQLINMKYGERTDEEGYTSEWLLELDKWLVNSDLEALGIWTDGDIMFGGDAALFIGYYIENESFDWITDISIKINKFKQICSQNKIELEQPDMHHRDDTGFAYACDHDFKKRLTPEELEKLEEKNKAERVEKVKRAIESLQDKSNNERFWIVHQFPFREFPEIYSLCKELLREPDEEFWNQLQESMSLGLGVDYIGEILPEMIFGLKSESEIVRRCSKMYLSEYLSWTRNTEPAIYVESQLKELEKNALHEILQLGLPSSINDYKKYYKRQLEEMNTLISQIIDSY